MAKRIILSIPPHMLSILTVLAILTLTATVAPTGRVFSAATSSPIPAASPLPHAGFPVTLDGAQIRNSSVALGDLNGDGVDDIVVGGSDGKVHAYRGNGTKLWDYDTGDAAIEGKAAIGDIDNDGQNEVVIGAGSTFTPNANGGLYVLDHLGRLRCSFQTLDTFPPFGAREGVYASPALADIDQNDGGKLEIAFSAWDGHVRVLNDNCSVVWDKFVRDSVWSSPAIGDIDGDGSPEVVVGVDAHEEPGFGTHDGGILHVYKANGSEVPGFPIQIDEVIYSSPALGDINGDGNLDIVVGTGKCWSVPGCAVGQVHPGVGEYLNAWDHTGHYLPGWPKALNNTYAFASPALADIDNDGLPEVIVNTADGYVHALNADASEVPGWPVLPTTPSGVGTVVHLSTVASPIVADLTGDGNLEVVLPSNWELVAWGRAGNQLTRNSFPPAPGALDLTTKFSLNSSAAVGDIDGDGKLELVVGGGASGGGSGALYAWDFGGGTAAAALPWPTFRHDALNNALFATPALRPTASQIFVLLETGRTRSFGVGIADAAGGNLSWTASDNQDWIRLSPGNGGTPGTLTITVDSSGKAVGTYDGTVTLASTAGDKTISVRMIVADTVYDVSLPITRR